MNKKQLSFLKNTLTTEQFEKLMSMSKAMPGADLKKCEANKRDGFPCGKNAKNDSAFCGVHHKTVEKVSDALTEKILTEVC